MRGGKIVVEGRRRRRRGKRRRGKRRRGRGGGGEEGEGIICNVCVFWCLGQIVLYVLVSFVPKHNGRLQSNSLLALHCVITCTKLRCVCIWCVYLLVLYSVMKTHFPP